MSHDRRGTTLVAATLLLLGTAALAQVPEAELRFNQGLTHMREGRIDMAIEAIKKAIKEDGKNPYFYKGLGLAYAQKNDFKQAIEAFRKALELNPYYVDVRNDLGSALVLAGKREEGKAEFLKALNDPTNPTPEVSCRNLGQAYFEEKNWAQAEHWFDTSLKRNPRYPDAHLGLADALTATGRLTEAVARLEAAANALPEDASVLFALGHAYYRAGRFGEARSRLEDVARKDPASPAARRAAELLKNFPK